MRHLLVASANETLLEELRAAAPPSVTLLSEPGDVDAVLERLSRSSRMDAVLTDNIWGYLWGKMGYGAMLFATATNNDSMTANFADPERFTALAGLAREVMAIAAARGVKPLGFNGYDPAAYAPGAGDAAARASIAALAEFNSKTAKTHSGVWRDLAVRKRRTEVDAQIGIMSRLGREAGIPTPMIDRLVAVIHDIEEGRRGLDVANMAVIAGR